MGVDKYRSSAGAVKIEDAAFADEDHGIAVLVVRRDTASTMASADGDYTLLTVDANGRLHILDQNSAAIAASLALLDNAIPSGNELQVDVVAALPAGTNAIGKVSHDKTGIGHGVKTVTTALSDEALAASTAAKVVIIQAQTDNTSAVAIGATGVDATVATGNGILLYAGDTIVLEIDNLADVYVDALVSGEGVRYSYET